MSDLILTSYLENNELKAEIVKDSVDFWDKLINKFRQQCGPKIRQNTIDKWKQLEKRQFSDRVLEHTTYWLLAEKYNLNPKTNKNDADKTWELTQQLDLYQRVKLVEHLF